MPARNRKLKIADIKVSCGSCSLSELCLPHGMSHDDMDELDKIVKRQQPFQPGQHIFKRLRNAVKRHQFVELACGNRFK